MSSLLRMALKTVIWGFIMSFLQLARAEYYLEYPEPVITQVIEYHSPVHHQKLKKRHRHTHYHAPRRPSHYSIEVTYYWPVCPGCACMQGASGCYPNDEQLNTKAVTGAYVTFRYDKMNFGKMRYRQYEANPTYDQRTEDDDVMQHPDMNNQYNMF